MGFMDEERERGEAMELSVQGESRLTMVTIKIWKDSDGYGVEIDSEKFGLSEFDMGQLIDELRALVDEPIDEDDGILREIALGLDDE
jgi:hypothetical protein